MPSLALLFFRNYWKEMVIIVGVVAIGLFVMNYFHLRDELAQKEIIIQQIEKEKKGLKLTLENLSKISEEQQNRIKEADEERKKVLDKLAKDINKIRLQTIPKDCQGAVDFAIKNKGDLKW